VWQALWRLPPKEANIALRRPKLKPLTQWEPRSVVAAKRSEPGPGIRSGPTREQSEELALIAALGAEDADAFRTLVTRHLPAVLATAQRMLADAAGAEDVAQETMLRLWRSRGEVDIGPGGLRPWLRRVAVNLCIDRMRAGRREAVVAEPPAQADPPSQLAAVEGRQLAERVGAALAALPERQRQAIVLFHYEGLSQIEIAQAMGISDEAVESLLARARRVLRGGLEKDWRDLVADGA
jgi:RNA polymerase sigma-70 factor (ECF subfamily)